MAEEKKSFTVDDSLDPAEIIRNHIKKILTDENIENYSADINKLEDLLSTEIDDKYEEEEKTNKKEVSEFKMPITARLTGSSYNGFFAMQEAKREQLRQRLTFRSLVKLAKRKGLWLVDEEDAHISYDKKKVTSMDSRFSRGLKPS